MALLKAKQVQKVRKTSGKSPFARLGPAHRKIVKREEATPYEQRVKDWIHVKQSANGSAKQRKKVSLVLPVSGHSIQI
jgi:hypothetical protein